MDGFDKFYNKALKFLSFRPRSEKEIRSKLELRIKNQELGIKESIINSVIEKLKEKKFIDDLEFAKWWIEQRTMFKIRSLNLIKRELMQKGIAKDIIESQISNFLASRRSGQFPISNETEMAKKLINKKINHYKKLPFDAVKIKIQRLLLSRGFSFETIKEALEDFRTELSSVDKN